MRKVVILFLISIILFSCSLSKGLINDHKYPTSNSGQNEQYYKLTTNMDWPAKVKPEELENYITWQHAIDLVLDGQVITIAQSHSLAVTLFLDNGEMVQTIEPNIDDIFLIISKCGVTCKNIGQITE